MSAMSPSRRRVLVYAPLAVAGAAGLGFWAMLRGLQDGSFNPRGVPSALIGRAPPDFALPEVEGAGLPAFAASDLRGTGRPVLVNFWASWCVPCIIEHPQLMALHREGVPVLGVNYKDRPADARTFLGRHGNPFARLGADQPGRVAIEWGVYGVPESYVIGRDGLVKWRWAGPITAEMMPELRRLLA
ncbi:DsbE family thiol:disulfide interchange protein [Sabulicella glaciei]|uniref:DsbE family thiol:disulfide interchange protein n=1 Tax=Sabulicella glaciei TaxID=2984948 RepID=A0ABT3NY54_9PROT|nr:DsbE family thiol:disulfide interchange protein [Roseococcus sp. MDT2-1-1]MCW8087061.1 DsbE family thiol:disulfide interchange protein [Roseococcus sp. MDT2-1-1]